LIKCGKCKERQARYFVQDKFDENENGHMCEECFVKFFVWAKRTYDIDFEDRFEVKPAPFVFR
jgi:protein-arginine kinase activator protein McsA